MTEKKVYELTVDSEFRDLIPPLNEEELKLLEESIVADGCESPLIVWNGVIVDGHNRYAICRKHGIPFSIQEKNFSSRDDAMLWMLRNQLGRRNLNNYQRVELVLKFEPFVEAVNRLISRREEILNTAEAFSTMLAETSGLEKQLDRLTAGKDVILRKLTVMVHENAVKEQDQEEYRRRYEMAESKLTRLDTEMEKLKTKKADRLLRRNKLRAFMGRLRAAEQLAAFDEGMFLGLTETVRVCPDKLVFVFRDGTEIPV